MSAVLIVARGVFKDSIRDRVDSLQAAMRAGTFSMPELDYAFPKPEDR